MTKKKENKKMPKKQKSMKEISKDFDKFIEGKELNPNNKEDFKKLTEKAAKPQKKK